MKSSYYHIVRGMAAVQSGWQTWLVRRGLADEKRLEPALAFLEQLFLNRMMLPALEPLYPAFLAWLSPRAGLPEPAGGPGELLVDWGGRLMLRLDLEALFSIVRGCPAHAGRRGASAGEIDEWKSLGLECRALLRELDLLPVHAPAPPEVPELEAQEWLAGYLSSYCGQPLRTGPARGLERLDRLLRRLGRLLAGGDSLGASSLESALDAVIHCMKLLNEFQEDNSEAASGLGAPMK